MAVLRGVFSENLSSRSQSESAGLFASLSGSLGRGQKLTVSEKLSISSPREKQNLPVSVPTGAVRRF